MRFALVTLILGVSSVALAQASGGSIGGGGWSGGGGEGGGGVGISGGTTDTTSAYPSGAGRGPLSASKLVFALIGGSALLIALAVVTKPRPVRRDFGGEPTDVRVGVVHVAIAGEERARVQSALSRIARIARTADREGRAEMLHEVAMLLRRLASSSAYVGGLVERAATRRDARRSFQGHVAETRELTTGERIRNTQGIVTISERPPFPDDTDDGFGLVLVTIVIATRGDMFEHVPIDRSTLTGALAAACNVLPDELVAVEVLWTPASDGETLTAFALEARLGRKLTRLEGVIVGTSICAHCGSAYRAELVRCSRCGGQASRATS